MDLFCIGGGVRVGEDTADSSRRRNGAETISVNNGKVCGGEDTAASSRRNGVETTSGNNGPNDDELEVDPEYFNNISNKTVEKQ